MAALALALGERELALDWLERAYGERNNFLLFLGIDPLFDDLLAEPRAVALLDRIGTEPAES